MHLLSDPMKIFYIFIEYIYFHDISSQGANLMMVAFFNHVNAFVCMVINYPLK